MIEVTKTGKCRDCPCFLLDYSVCYADDAPYMTIVQCKNARICDYLEQRIRQQVTLEAINE